MVFIRACIIVGGILSLLMVIFHSRFYQLFDWGKEFKKITPKNQRIFYTIHIALLLLFVAFAILSFAYIDELSQATGLALGVMGLYSVFWLWRALWQIFYFRLPPKSGVRNMSFLHYVLIAIFILLFIVYLVPIIARVLL